ncbi:MAG: P-II family nitrogen regulator [Oscillospiraceae bacterium]
MIKIEAYIRPEKLEDVNAIMDTFNLTGMSILQVMGFGKQKGWKEIIRGTEVDFNFVQKIKLEIVLMDSQVDEVVGAITDALCTGEFGDGKIFTYEVKDAIRIRTKEHGEDAIK